MKVYTELFTGTEIITDSFDFESMFDGALVKIKSSYINVGGENYDIGGGNHFGGGGEDEQVDDQVQKVLNVLDAGQYQEFSFQKEDYKKYIKGYMKSVRDKLAETNPDRVKPFMAGAAEAMKFILKNFSELSFYLPQDNDCEHLIILSMYEKEEDECPTFYYWMDGLVGKNV